MFIYFDDGFAKKIADCVDVDDIPGSYKTSCVINGKQIRLYPLDVVNGELKEELKFPSISWKRYDRKFDPTRYVNDNDLFKTKDEDGRDIFIKVDLPQPTNFFYQVELRAKSQHDIDMLELWFEAHIDLRGDVVTIPIFIEEDGKFSSLDFPLDLVEQRNLDDVEASTNPPANARYRRVYSFKVEGLIDMNNFKASPKQVISMASSEPLNFGVRVVDEDMK